jgi:hypothetical protein
MPSDQCHIGVKMLVKFTDKVNDIAISVLLSSDLTSKLRPRYGKIMFLDLSEDISSVCWRIEEFAYQSMLFNLRTIFSPR